MFNSRSGFQLIGYFTQKLEINQEGSSFEINGYKNSYFSKVVFHVSGILSLGILYILVSWFPQLNSFKLIKCPLINADALLVKDENNSFRLIDVQTERISLQHLFQLNQIRYFVFRQTKYILDDQEGIFKPLDDFLPKFSLSSLDNSIGVTDNERNELIKLFGKNEIDIKVPSYWKLFVNEVFNPFYLFQLFSIILWCVDEYIIYAICILLLTVLSIIATLRETRKQSEAVHNLVKSSITDCTRILKHNVRGEEEYNVLTTEIVPGDIIVIPRSGCLVPCDAVLLSGNCIVNESMLTGESTPITKTPPHASSEIYDVNVHKKHTLFCGTQILQARYYGKERVLARAITTGFNTMKGELVKSILFPVPINLKFYKDSMKFLWLLSIIAISGMGYCIYLYYKRGVDISYIIIRSLDIITIVVPPALPAAMTIGIAYSQNRLKKLNIFCTSPPRINLAGKLKLACFDKTGTLTEDGLELKYVVRLQNDCLNIVDNLHSEDFLVQAMATCHSLTRIGGKLTGDPLDISMFESLNWDLEEPGENEDTRYDTLAPIVVKPKNFPGGNVEIYLNGMEETFPYCIGILRQFPFSSTLQCMTVLTRTLGATFEQNIVAFSKGAPEKIKSFCKFVSPDFYSCLSKFTSDGCRVIAFSAKSMSNKFNWKDSQKIPREDIECDMDFLGFIVFLNSVKPETLPVIQTLKNADIKTVMITGDNIQTAICVAKKCEMVDVLDKIILVNMKSKYDNEVPNIVFKNEEGSTSQYVDYSLAKYHFAIDGKTWSKLKEYYADYLPHILVRSTIFARFQPDQKTQLINSFQKLGYTVAMVGDGANDCGALKAAHVGVSLSQAEASVAAPFTSSIPNISCIIHLILEGRCTLVTSFALFKYMALYSLIQFSSILLLYTHHSILGDAQFLFIDLIITTSLAVTMAYQGPAKKIQKDRPLGSLVRARNLIPLITQVILCFGVQLTSYYYLSMQPWFKPLPVGKEEVILCWENTVLFIVSSYQYIIIAVVYSKGKPFRSRLITNFWFIISAFSLTLFLTWLDLRPVKEVADFFEIMDFPLKEQQIFRYYLLLLPSAHLILAAFIESAVADRKWFKIFLKILSCRKKSKNNYKIFLEDKTIERWLYSSETNESLSIPVANFVQ